MKTNSRVKLIVVIGMILMGFTACKKDKNVLTTEATVVYTGSIAVDGCEWLIYVEGVGPYDNQTGPSRTYYNVVNLPERYKQNNLKVVISYKLLSSRYHCGMIANDPGIEQIEVKEINKK